MEFAWSAEDIAFRTELGAFLDDELPAWWRDGRHMMISGEDYAEFAREFTPKLADRGWLTPHWPAEYGGRDASALQHLVITEEMWLRGEPRGCEYMSVNWVGPAIMKFGTQEQKDYFLPRIAAGGLRWCQGFSEPEAGSDLANLRTAAVREGDEYVVNGQKIWTSYSKYAEFCFLLVRTGRGSKGRDGISVLLVPTDTPGFVRRSFDHIVGDHAFGELFFEEMRVPVSCRLGDEDRGWEVTMTALSFERAGVCRYARAQVVLDAAKDWLRQRGRLDDPHVQSRIGEAEALCEAARLLTYKVYDQRGRSDQPSADTNVSIVAQNVADKTAAAVVFELMGEESLERDSLADQHLPLTLHAGITGGATEIQLGLIARRLLGLPSGN